MEFVAATNNAHKLAEMRRILVRMGHTVLSQREAGVLLEPEETGALRYRGLPPRQNVTRSPEEVMRWLSTL